MTHTLKRWKWLALALALAVAALAGCREPELPPAAGAATPGMTGPIGPIPGPARVAARSVNPYANNPSALAQGRALFVWFNCSGCHGGHAGGGMGPSLRDPDWIYGSSDAEVFDSIAEGRAHGMPAWGMTLPRDTIWKLTAYVRSLGTPQEPEKPE